MSVDQNNENISSNALLTKLIEDGKVSRYYVEDGIRLDLKLYQFEDDHEWQTIVSEMSNTKDPLRELQLTSYFSRNDLIAPGFSDFVKCIANHRTLIKVNCSIGNWFFNTTAALLEALKDNRFIRHLSVESVDFEFAVVPLFAQTLMNNTRLLTLTLSLFAAPEEDHFPALPVEGENGVILARALQTTVLERLTISCIHHDCFQALAESLPNTLVYLDLSDNWMNKNNISTLHSYLNSNGSSLKELIIDDHLGTEYFKQYPLPLASTVKIAKKNSWQARFIRKEYPLRIELKDMSESEWSQMFAELDKDGSDYRAINFAFNSELDRKHLDKIRTLLSNQYRLKHLVITGDLSDASVQHCLFQYLKEANLITNYDFQFKIDSNLFNEFIDFLSSKTNIDRLALSSYPNISDDEALMLIQGLKNNRVFRSLVINGSTIGDRGFQALLCSLPKEFSELHVKESTITAASLPALLDFIADRPTLYNVHLGDTSIQINNPTNIDVTEFIEKIREITTANNCNVHFSAKEVVTNAMISVKNNFIKLDGKGLVDDDILVLYSEFQKKPTRNWSLDLMCNYAFTVIGCRHLANILSSTINIVQIILGYNRVNDEAQTILFNGLSENKTLEFFSITDEVLRHEDMICIARFMQINPNLKNIRLQSDGKYEGLITPLIDVLPNTKLEKLNLSFNHLRDIACASLLSSIPSTLVELSLQSNDLTESFLPTILSFLSTNQTLKRLNIRCNPVFDDEDKWNEVQQVAVQKNICELN